MSDLTITTYLTQNSIYFIHGLFLKSTTSIFESYIDKDRKAGKFKIGTACIYVPSTLSTLKLLRDLINSFFNGDMLANRISTLSTNLRSRDTIFDLETTNNYS